MRFSKKGIQWETIVGLTLLLLLVAAMIPFMKNFVEGAKDSTDVKACKTSVLWKGSTAGFVREKIHGDVELKCPVSEVDILADGDKKLDNGRNIFVKNEEDVEEIIAKEMYECFDKFGRGRIDFVEAPELRKVTCFTCSHIKFGDKLKKDIIPDKQINDFDRYLVENKIPGTEESYYDFFGSSLGFTDPSEFRLDVPIEDEGGLAIVYALNKEGYLVDLGITASGVFVVGKVFQGGKWIYKAVRFGAKHKAITAASSVAIFIVGKESFDLKANPILFIGKFSALGGLCNQLGED